MKKREEELKTAAKGLKAARSANDQVRPIHL